MLYIYISEILTVIEWKIKLLAFSTPLLCTSESNSVSYHKQSKPKYILFTVLMTETDNAVDIPVVNEWWL